MKTVTFYNHKGGVGKTSTAGCAAHALAKAGNKVALFDFDSQGNLTKWMGKSDIRHDLKNFIENADTVKLPDIKIEVKENLFLYPTKTESNLSEIKHSVLLNDPKFFCRKRSGSFLDQLKNENYDFVIFDLAPAFEQIEISLMDITDEIILIVEPEFFSIAGVTAVIQKINKIINQSDNENIVCNKIVLNKVNFSFSAHTELSNTLIESLTEFSFFLIPQDAALKNLQTPYEARTPYDDDKKTVKIKEAYDKLIHIF